MKFFKTPGGKTIIVLAITIAISSVGFGVAFGYGGPTGPTIDVYTLDNPKISPNADGIKDTATIDLAFSEQVSADVNILDSLGNIVNNLYTSASVTNPTPKVWNGKDDAGIDVPEGVYTIEITITNALSQTTVDTAKTITVDRTPPVITLNGGASLTIYQGSIYVDLGANASDAVDGDLTGSIVVTNPVDANTIGSYNVAYNVSDGAGNPAVQVNRTVEVIATAGNQIVLAPTTDVSAATPEVVVSGDDNFAATVNVPSTVANATINVSAIVNTTPTESSATLNNSLTISADTSAGNVNIQIPAGTQISGSTSWLGIINVPQVQANSSVTVTPDSGYTAAVSSVIEIGFGDIKLVFNKAVRVLISGQGGKLVGYYRGGVFTQITNTCSADTQAAGDALPAEGDCKITVGNDLIIWTKHFTKFVTYTQTAISQPSTGGGGGYVFVPSIGSGNVTTAVPMAETRDIGEVTQIGNNIFVYINSKFYFAVMDAGVKSKHSATITFMDLDRKNINILFNETRKVLIGLIVGENKEVDLDGDGKNDIRITFNNLIVNKADLTIVDLPDTAGGVETPVVAKPTPEVLGLKLYDLAFKNGDLIRNPKDNKIYVLQNNFRRHIVSLEILKTDYRGQPIYNVSEATLARYPLGKVLGVKLYDLAFKNGTLLRNPYDFKIYVLENGKKRHIISLEIFKAKYSGQPVYNVSEAVLARYPAGDRILK